MLAPMRLVSCGVLWLAVAPGCSESPAPRPSVVLVVVDTLRADSTTSHGHPRDLTPRLARFADSGAVFLDCFAVSPWTTPSVASLVTGRYPDELGIRRMAQPLPEGAVTLAERLRAAGYATGAVVSNGMAGPQFGFDAGYDSFAFERYKEDDLDTTGYAAKRPSFTADRVTDRALEWLEGAREPFFLYVHYTDPHEPYLPPQKWRAAFSADPALPDELLLGLGFVRSRRDAGLAEATSPS